MNLEEKGMIRLNKNMLELMKLTTTMNITVLLLDGAREGRDVGMKAEEIREMT